MVRRAVLIAVGVSGCSLVTDLSGLGDDASIEAGPDATLDAPIEAASDASPDAAPDVAIEAEAGPFCGPYTEAGPLVYCQDFDTPDASVGFLTSGFAVAAVDTASALSQPASLLTTVAVADAGNAHAYNNHVMPVAPSIATLAFAIKVDAVGAAYVNIVELVFAETTGTRYLILQIDPTGMTLEEEYPAEAGINTLSHPHIPIGWDGAWHHVVVTANLSGATKTSSLAFDSQTLEANYPLHTGWTAALFNVAIGVTYAPAPSTAWAVRFDDQLVQLTL